MTTQFIFPPMTKHNEPVDFSGFDAYTCAMLDDISRLEKALRAAQAERKEFNKETREWHQATALFCVHMKALKKVPQGFEGHHKEITEAIEHYNESVERGDEPQEMLAHSLLHQKAVKLANLYQAWKHRAA